jgi:alpha-L-rhamnosidase
MRHFFLLLAALTGFNSLMFAKSPLAPDHLRVCDKVNPVGTSANPYFGWYVNDPDDNEIQQAWQILVASSPDKLNAGDGDVWNSGKTLSRLQNYIYFPGKQLSSSTKYYWKIRTWDKDGNESPWSDVASFETGLLTFSDWGNARWIKRNTKDGDDYTYFRKKTDLPGKTIKRATLYVSACHSYELYVNGQFIGKGFNNHYPQYSYYNAWDISSVIKTQSPNTFACLTHWYGGGQGRAAGTRGFLLKAVVEFTDGSTSEIVTDSTWKQKQAEMWIPNQRQRNGEGIGRIEAIDSRKEIDGWYSVKFDDSAWQNATEIGAVSVNPWVNPLRADLTRVIESDVKPLSVKSIGKGKYVIDLGKIYPGMPLIKFEGGKAGDTVKMYGGFVLENDGSVSTKVRQSTNMNYVFILNGKDAIFQPAIYLGMRYIQVENAPNTLSTDNVRFVCRHFELDPSRAAFASSNPMLNKVWELMTHSLIAGAQEGFVDTSTREKGSFLGDGWSQAVSAMWSMGDRMMNNRVLDEFLNSQDQYWPDGQLNAVYPNVDGKRDIPDFTQSYLVWAWDYYTQTGNTEYLKTNYERLKKIANYVDAYRNPATGLIHNLAGGAGQYKYGIIDWPPSMRYGYDVSAESRTVIDAYAYIDFLMVSQIANVLGNQSDAAFYKQKAEDMKTAINTRLLTSKGVYSDGLLADLSQSVHISQHANMMPLAMGIVPEANRMAVTNQIKQMKMSCGMVTVRWLTEAMGQAAEGEHLLELFTNTEWDGWAKNITQGATVTWEAWDSNTDDGSLSHPWGTASLQAIYQYILGVKILKPQHELIQIKPLDFGQKLTFVKGVLPTDRGDIAVSWERKEDNFSLQLSIPDNMLAKVYIPKCGLDGNTLWADGVKLETNTEGDYLCVENVGSGSHIFKLKN